MGKNKTGAGRAKSVIGQSKTIRTNKTNKKK